MGEIILNLLRGFTIVSILATIQLTAMSGSCKKLKKRFPCAESLELYLCGLESKGLRGTLLESSFYSVSDSRNRSKV